MKIKLPAGIAGFTYGVATAGKSGGKVRVKVGGQILTARCPRDLDVSSGDVVVMARAHSALWILNRYFVDGHGQVDIGGTDEPAAPGGTITGRTTFVAKATATYRLGWRTDSDSMYQGTAPGTSTANTGVAFYGKQLTPLVGVDVLAATLKAQRLPGGPIGKALTTLWGVVQGTRPAGAPTLSATSYTGPNLAPSHIDPGVPVNTTLAQALVDGTYAGLAVYDPAIGLYVRLAGLKEYAGAFALTIDWRRAA